MGTVIGDRNGTGRSKQLKETATMRDYKGIVRSAWSLTVAGAVSKRSGVRDESSQRLRECLKVGGIGCGWVGVNGDGVVCLMRSVVIEVSI